MARAASAHSVAAGYSPARRRLALGIAAMAFLLELLDSTIVNLAIPAIRGSLGASAGMIQWIVAGYALSFSMLLILGGRLGDNFGYRRMFLLGVGAFALASLFCGLAASPLQLVLARVFQGAAAALMAPQVMAIVQLLYRPHERGPVMGLFGALGGLGASLGPLVGGLLIRADVLGLGWRPIFLINLPLAVAALVAGGVALPPGRSPHPARPDLVGALVMIAAIFFLVCPLIQGREAGWPAWSFGMLALSAALLATYVAHVRRKALGGQDPLTPPILFKRRSFSAGLGVCLLLQCALAGYFLVFSLLLQLGIGLDVLRASLATLPFSGGVAIGIAVISRRLAVRLGRRLVSMGMLALACGWSLLAASTRLGEPHTALGLAPVLLLAGLGMGMSIGPLSSLVLSEVEIAYAGAAAGVLNAVQQLGGAVGAAVIGSIYFALQRGRTDPGAFERAFAPTMLAALALLLLALMLVQLLPREIRRPSPAVH